MNARTIQPSNSLRFLKGSLNLILVPASLLTFFVFWSAAMRPDWHYANISIYGLGYIVAALFAGLYLCRLAVLWQMRRSTTTRTKKTRKVSSRTKSVRKLPYSLKAGDWVIELSALIWVAALFLFAAYLVFERVIPLGFNSFN